MIFPKVPQETRHEKNSGEFYGQDSTYFSFPEF
jgi:hypothetical protein